MTIQQKPTSHRLRVLVVEDCLVNRRLLTLLLKSFDCDVSIAVNGQEGVDQFEACPFDVVLMDVQMPVMDGLTATRIIRHHEISTGTRSLIVAVTAGVDRESCLEAGMDDHMQKPIRPKMLAGVLETCRAMASVQ